MKKNKYVAPTIETVEMETSEILAASISSNGTQGYTGDPETEGDAGGAASKDIFDLDVWE